MKFFTFSSRTWKGIGSESSNERNWERWDEKGEEKVNKEMRWGPSHYDDQVEKVWIEGDVFISDIPLQFFPSCLVTVSYTCIILSESFILFSLRDIGSGLLLGLGREIIKDESDPPNNLESDILKSGWYMFLSTCEDDDDSVPLCDTTKQSHIITLSPASHLTKPTNQIVYQFVGYFSFHCMTLFFSSSEQ